MTFQWAPNFGAQLQNYALSEKIKEMGYFPRTIKWGYDYYNTLGNRNDNLRFFSERKIFKTRTCYTSKDLKNVLKEGHIVIFGGDQIFRNWEGSGSRQLQGEELPLLRYYGDFVTGKKVMVSYAASFGIDRFVGDKYLKQECKKLLNRFDKLSVRERAGVNIINQVFDMEAIEVLDPVFLIPDKVYESLISQASAFKNHEPGYIAYMAYGALGNLGALSEELDEILKKRAIIDIMRDENGRLNTVEQWLYNIKNASYVITNSFHCMAFAIIFHKPFIVLATNPNDTRITNLLENLKLQKCKRDTLEDITTNDLGENIDWERVDNILIRLRADSEKYLSDVLNLKAEYKKPYINMPLRGIRKRYEMAYCYRKKAQEALFYKFGFRQRVIRIIIKFIVDTKRYKKLKRDHILFFRDSKSRFIQFLGKYYN